MINILLSNDYSAIAHLMMGIALVTISVVGLAVTFKLCSDIIWED